MKTCWKRRRDVPFWRTSMGVTLFDSVNTHIRGIALPWIQKYCLTPRRLQRSLLQLRLFPMRSRGLLDKGCLLLWFAPKLGQCQKRLLIPRLLMNMAIGEPFQLQKALRRKGRQRLCHRRNQSYGTASRAKHTSCLSQFLRFRRIVIAEKYDIGPLKRLSLHKLHQTMVQLFKYRCWPARINWWFETACHTPRCICSGGSSTERRVLLYSGATWLSCERSCWKNA